MKSLSRKSPGYRWAREHLLPTEGARAAWAFQERLERSQWYTPAQHQAYQQKRLGELLRHAEANVPYYADTFRTIGLDTSREFTAEQWRRIPLLTRAALQDNEAELRALRYPREHGKATKVSSSGSTGTPVEALVTELAGSWNRALNLRGQLWAHKRLDYRLAVIRFYREEVADFPDGMVKPAWGSELTLPVVTGPMFGLAARTPTTGQVEWLNRLQPEVLLIYPSLLPGLLDAVAGGALRLNALKRIMTISETLEDEVRDGARQLLGVDIFDVYSANETGAIALQCPEGHGYHIQSEALLVEVLGETEEPCKVGETGRVVITELHNYATPIIRYDIGDFATVGRSCRCGRGLPVLTRIVGRHRNMMIGPNGERLRPSLGMKYFREIAPVEQVQLVQHTINKLEARLVAKRALSAYEEDGLRKHLRSRAPQFTEIIFTYLEEIPRGHGGKFEDFVSLIGPRREPPSHRAHKKPSL